jgi:hypothetical protein
MLRFASRLPSGGKGDLFGVRLLNNGLLENGALVDVILLVLVLVVTFGPVAHRMLAPIPRADEEAIEAYLADHGQMLVRVERRAFGGPWHRHFGSLPFQGGRPYRALARAPDGREWTHVVAVDGRNHAGAPLVKERVGGGWTPA